MFNRPTRTLRLRKPVGNGMANDPDDVMAVQRRLGAEGLYNWDDDGPSGFIDSDLLAGIRKLQLGKGLAVDGWLAPGGETERNLNRPPDRTPDFNPYLEHAEPVDIAGEVGNGRANDEADVTGVKRALSALGLYQYDLTSDPSPFIDRGMLDGITAFQQQNGLKVDGWLGRGGETQAAMNAALASQTPEQAPPARPSRNLLAGNDDGSGESIDMNDRPVQVAQAKRRGIIGAVGNALRDLVMPPPPPSPPKPVESPKPTQTPVPDNNSETKPVVPDDGKRDPFFDQIGIYAQEELNKRPGRTGGKEAKESVNILSQECKRILEEEYPHLAPFVERTGGGQLEGENERMGETYIRGLDTPPGSTKGGSYADSILFTHDGWSLELERKQRNSGRDSWGFADHSWTWPNGYWWWIMGGKPASQLRLPDGRIVQYISGSDIVFRARAAHPEEVRLVESLLRPISRLATRRMQRFELTSPEKPPQFFERGSLYWAGHHAVAWARESPDRYLACQTLGDGRVFGWRPLD